MWRLHSPGESQEVCILENCAYVLVPKTQGQEDMGEGPGDGDKERTTGLGPEMRILYHHLYSQGSTLNLGLFSEYIYRVARSPNEGSQVRK